MTPAPGPGAPKLVVIDMQRVFQDEGQWQVPRYDEIVPVIEQLQQELGSGAVFTRFVRDETEHGAWAAYYQRWNEMRFPTDSNAWDITMNVPGTATVVDGPTFSKWGPELADRVGAATLLLAGVSTDCCVLSTAVAAADAGVPVQVVADACAGVSAESHRATLDVLALYGPLVRVVSSADLS